MREPCEIVAYVRSQKVVTSARSVRVVRTLSNIPFPIVQFPVRAVALTFGRRLGVEQSSVVAEARRLAAETGQRLRVVDLGRTNAIARRVRLWRLGGRVLPVVVMRGSCPWNLLGTGLPSPQPRKARV